ncbi:MAG TPA: PadR family transcriptional regulator [Candidatus Syntrophosphaera sp.]|nr:PadR family transcriptional regulator [Candidatus Syntrophosphaera sp.]
MSPDWRRSRFCQAVIFSASPHIVKKTLAKFRAIIILTIINDNIGKESDCIVITISKPKLVVLGFLIRAPMYGYQIGHIVEQFGLPIWAGIKLPSIYKALQDLESSRHIRGEQMTEGNNPPRTVFHINDEGRRLHRELVTRSLINPEIISQDWWLALSFAQGSLARAELEQAIHLRLQRLKHSERAAKENLCQNMLDSGQLPFVHRHIMRLGQRHHQAEEKTLKELLSEVLAGADTSFYLNIGEPN